MIRNNAILFVLVALTGCASTQDLINTVPSAVGTVAAAAIFGGKVSMNPEPVGYIVEDINRQSRQIYGDTRRNTTQAITDSIAKLFTPAK